MNFGFNKEIKKSIFHKINLTLNMVNIYLKICLHRVIFFILCLTIDYEIIKIYLWDNLSSITGIFWRLFLNFQIKEFDERLRIKKF